MEASRQGSSTGQTGLSLLSGPSRVLQHSRQRAGGLRPGTETGPALPSQQDPEQEEDAGRTEAERRQEMAR